MVVMQTVARAALTTVMHEPCQLIEHKKNNKLGGLRLSRNSVIYEIS